MDYVDKNIGRSKIKGQPLKPFVFKLKDNAVKTNHITDKAVTPSKLSDDVQREVVAPVVNAVDVKYQSITDELYRMCESGHEGGIVLLPGMGDKETLGVHQKGITKLLMRLWNKVSEVTGETYTVDYTMTVTPTYVYTEDDIQVTVAVDTRNSICGFDSIAFYVGDVLVEEARGVDIYTFVSTITKTSVIKCVAVMAGQTIVKQQTVTKEIPFFMGSGNAYTDIMNPACHKNIDGTLEGSYDVTVRNNGEHIIVIIPGSRIEEFRRCTMDVNGIEIPFNSQEVESFLVLKSVNTYDAGVYNIDININT